MIKKRSHRQVAHVCTRFWQQNAKGIIYVYSGIYMADIYVVLGLSDNAMELSHALAMLL